VTNGPHDFGARINELGNKSTQLLLFLTFAILGAATLMTKDCAGQDRLVRSAAWWWMWAVFPVLLGVLPIKDFNWDNRRWYRFLVCKVSVSVGVRDSPQCWCHSILRAVR
jgi:hypothetical protein